VALSACVTPRQVMASRPWSEVRTKHFRIITDADPEVAAKAAADLEVARHAFLAALTGGPEPEDASLVALLNDGDELAEVTPAEYAGFSFTDRGQGILVASASRAGADVRAVELHELTHLVLRRLVRWLPRWMNEGMAAYFETAQIDPRGEMLLGMPGRAYVHALSGTPWLDLERLWKWNPSNREELGRLYATSWALCRVLMNRYQEQLQTMLRSLAEGRDGRAAWKAAFGDLLFSSFQGEVGDTPAMAASAMGTLSFTPGKEEVATRPLSPGEAHAALAWLYSFAPVKGERGDRVAAVREELALAEKADPSAPLVREVLAGRDELEASERIRSREEASRNSPPVCPEDIQAGPALSPGGIAPRTVLRSTGKGGQDAPDDEGLYGVSFHEVIELGSGDVLLLGGTPDGAPQLALFRRAGPDTCAVNGWLAKDRPARSLSLARWWLTGDRARALLLVSIESGSARDRRWMALATDGRRAWWAARGEGGVPELGGAGEAHVSAGADGKLSLRIDGAGEYALDFEGPLGPAHEPPGMLDLRVW